MGLASLGSEWAANAIEPYTETIITNIVTADDFYKGRTEILSYDIKRVVKLGVPSLGVGKIGGGVISAGSGQLGIHGNSAASSKPTMVYEHTFQSGKTYTGVGDVNGKRAAQSAKKWGANDPLVSTKKTIAPDRKTAYGIEQVRIEMNGGVQSTRNYNTKNSPGLKIIKKIFK
jgi:hypothetical protein